VVFPPQRNLCGPIDRRDDEVFFSTSRPHHIPYTEISRKLVADSARRTGPGKFATLIRRSIHGSGRTAARRRLDSA
jgi:hypothetical protein